MKKNTKSFNDLIINLYLNEISGTINKNKIMLVINTIILLSNIVNFSIIRNRNLSFAILGACIFIFIEMLVEIIVQKQTYKKEQKLYDEYFDTQLELLKQLDEKDKK